QDQKEVTQDLKIKLQNHKVTFLGCFDKRLFEEIQKQFNNDQFIAIYLENKRGESIHYPHWLFDYDDDFYYKQNQIITESAGLLNDDIPTFEDFELVNLNISPLPLLIASGKWRQNLDYFDQWQLDFIKILWGDLKEYKDVKLPYIYLAILKHFLIVVTCNEQPKNYNPKDYEKLLYCTSNDSFPLKRYDPVCLEENMPTIRALCHTLNILFFDRSKINFNQFTRYQFRGTGLLTGITYQGERKTI
ncbi:hypothetical protein, partial [Picosynechococcus sp. NKBG042902]|uniref:hypothetical protein n=1 Tax=Picosynechococcus sp. NKBG042902 TaxID=490193 RepID=UPI0005EF31B9